MAVEMLPLNMRYIQIKALESNRTRKKEEDDEQIVKDGSVILGSNDLSLQSTTDKAD